MVGALNAIKYTACLIYTPSILLLWLHCCIICDFGVCTVFSNRNNVFSAFQQSVVYFKNC